MISYNSLSESTPGNGFSTNICFLALAAFNDHSVLYAVGKGIYTPSMSGSFISFILNYFY